MSEPRWLSAPARDIAKTARGLLGWELVAGDVRLRLTEVEAYENVDDPASHSFRGPTPRNAVMFGPAGFAYVYFVFGMHWCLNIVCGRIGEASAVLVRAGAVTAGVETVRERRGNAPREHELARGPGLLAVALGVDRAVNGTSLVDGSGPLTLVPPRRAVPAAAIEAGPRVGVAAAAERPWRFWLAGDPSVSAYRRHVPRRRADLRVNVQLDPPAGSADSRRAR